MNSAQAARAISLVMRGVEAFEARNLKLAAAAFATAREETLGGPRTITLALGDAAAAVRRDDFQALMAAVARVGPLADYDRPAPQKLLAPEPEPPPKPKPVMARRPEPRLEPSIKPAATPVTKPVVTPEPSPPKPVVVSAGPPPDAVIDQTAPPPPAAESLAAAPLSNAALSLGEAEDAVRRGDLPAALDALGQAIAARRADPGEDLPAGQQFSRLGARLAEDGAWRPAAQALREALAAKSRVLGGAHRRLAGDLLQLSAVSEHLGDDEQALTLAERALRIGRLHGAQGELADALARHGAACLALEAFSAAAASFREALAIGAAEGRDDLWTARMLDGLGLAMARLETPAAAQALHERAFALRRARLPDGHPDLGWSYLHLGESLLNAGRHDEAEARIRAALGCFERAGPDQAALAQCLERLAVLQARRGSPAAGAGLLRDAVARLQEAYGPGHRLVLTYETELAFLSLAAGDPGAALALGRGALRRARPQRHKGLRRDLWALLSQLAVARQETGPAILFGKLAALAMQGEPGGAARLETAPQRLFGTRAGEMHRHLAVLLAAAGRLPEAGIALAMLKEEELFDLLGRDPGADPRRAFMPLNAAEAEWQGQGGLVLQPVPEDEASSMSPARRLAELNFFEAWVDSAAAICKAAPVPADTRHPGLPALGARVAVLRLLPGPQTLHLLFCTTEFQIGREVAVAAPVLRGMVRAFRTAIGARRPDVPALGLELYRYLIAPVAGIYRDLGINTLLIGAGGWLRYLPFAALHDGERYLAETTATALLTEAAPDAAGAWGKSGMAAFGVSGIEDGLPRLVQGAGKVAGELVMDEAFNAASLAAGLVNHGLIHLATRVVLKPDDPAGSALTLGDGSMLRLPELAAAPFDFRDVPLVALTACETAADGDGREIEALGAILRWRGAHSVLATLWRPQSGPVAAAIAAFYGQRRGGRSAARALNAAQGAVLAGEEAYRHAYYWAGFIAMGGIE